MGSVSDIFYSYVLNIDIPIIPVNARKIPKYFFLDIFSFSKNLDNKTVKAPLLPVMGEAIEAGAYEKLSHKNPVPIMLNKPPNKANL